MFHWRLETNLLAFSNCQHKGKRASFTNKTFNISVSKVLDNRIKP